MIQSVLFDMDGVLVDSTRAIGLGINHALEALGRATLADAEVRAYIGPPLELIAEPSAWLEHNQPPSRIILAFATDAQSFMRSIRVTIIQQSVVRPAFWEGAAGHP